jgi:hypothetical protein
LIDVKVSVADNAGEANRSRHQARRRLAAQPRAAV